MNPKRFVSVICEYNPFHFGHLFQLERLKNEFDGVVCIMSGDVVQRGSVAIAGKYLRAETALRSGANLVLELPLPWCASSARDFASAGVHIAHNIGSSHLAFGAEDDIELLREIDSFISSPEFLNKIQLLVAERQNLSYPAAMTALVREELGDIAAEAIGKPNNILALEYLSSLKKTNILPYAVTRDLSLKSSSSIRSLNDGELMISELPEQSARVLSREMNVDFPRKATQLDSYFIGTLRRMNTTGEIKSGLYSAPDDLIKKLISESVHVNTVDELVRICTDKKYTSARVRRAILAVVFGITAERVHNMPPYTCVLGADDIGREILKNAKNNSLIDIITKPVRALSCGEKTKDSFSFAKGIEDIISLSAPKPEPADLGKTPIII